MVGERQIEGSGAVLLSLVVFAVAVLWVIVSGAWYFQHKEPNLSDGNLFNRDQSVDAFDVTQEADHKCEVIHVSIVVTGYYDSREVANLIKSILFYRNNPLYFHFITDTTARHILQTLIQTWDLSGVESTFYAAGQFLDNTKLVRMCNHSVPLPTLHLASLLPETLKKVIVLDTKMVLTSDIAFLWQQFDVMTDTKAIAIVENAKHDLTRGEIFDTGVMLMNLKKLRYINWMEILLDSCPETSEDSNITVSHLEQIVINTAITQYGNLIHVLPCTWNLQLDESTSNEYCKDEICDLTQIKVIQWRLPIQPRRFPKVNFFKYVHDLYSTLQEFDGNFLRLKAYQCVNLREDPLHEQMNQIDECIEFQRQRLLKYRTHLHVLPFRYSTKPDGYDVTLISHLSMDRLRMLEPLAKHWEGPMSISVYVTEAEARYFLQFIDESPFIQSRENIAYHLVYKNGHMYPSNYMRNVAVNEATTPFIFLIDIDFLPSYDAYTYLRKSIEIINPQHTKKALVVPAFETEYFTLTFPSSKKRLDYLLAGKKVNPSCPDFPPGHSPTNFSRWRTSSLPFKVNYEPDFEPYVVIRKQSPKYDERFVGYGGDKSSHSHLLQIERYEFIVLPNAFVIHMPHYPSKDRVSYDRKRNYYPCVLKLMNEFETELATSSVTHGNN